MVQWVHNSSPFHQVIKSIVIGFRLTKKCHGATCGNHWFSFGQKTYSYITGIVGNVLMVGAFQFVFANWYTMIQEGNRDNCYYNDFCYRVTNHDIPFNLMISNLPYIIHGLILAVWVLILETKLNVRFKSIEASCTGTGAAMAWESELPNHVLLCPETNFHLLKSKGILHLRWKYRASMSGDGRWVHKLFKSRQRKLNI